MLTSFISTTSYFHPILQQEGLLDGFGALLQTVWLIEVRVDLGYGYDPELTEYELALSQEEADAGVELSKLLCDEDKKLWFGVTKVTPRPYKRNITKVMNTSTLW